MNILDSIGDYIFVINKDYKIVFANKAMLQLCRQKKEDVIGQKCHEFSRKCHTPCLKKSEPIICPFDGVFKNGEPISVNHTHILPDGAERRFEITASLVKDEDGNFTEMIEIMRDVTERDRIEQGLKECEEKFRALVEHSLVGVYLIQDGVFKYVNPKLAEIFGYSQQDELIEKKGPKNLSYPDDWHIVEENLRRRLEGEIRSVNYTFRGQKKDGEVFDVEVFGSITTYRGRPAVIGTLLDITERRNLQNELEKRIKELEEFYDIAVNREIRMIELKGEIERLNEELKKHR